MAVRRAVAGLGARDGSHACVTPNCKRRERVWSSEGPPATGYRQNLAIMYECGMHRGMCTRTKLSLSLLGSTMYECGTAGCVPEHTTWGTWVHTPSLGVGVWGRWRRTQCARMAMHSSTYIDRHDAEFGGVAVARCRPSAPKPSSRHLVVLTPTPGSIAHLGPIRRVEMLQKQNPSGGTHMGWDGAGPWGPTTRPQRPNNQGLKGLTTRPGTAGGTGSCP
jgi:hypothetical protein